MTKLLLSKEELIEQMEFCTNTGYCSDCKMKSIKHCRDELFRRALDFIKPKPTNGEKFKEVFGCKAQTVFGLPTANFMYWLNYKYEPEKCEERAEETK